eukprot:Gb_30954 [translate_table: standard]
MEGTPLFPDPGKHCMEESCRTLDFLPLKCNGCNKVFCAEHRSEKDHDFPNVDMNDRQVIVCPNCSSALIKVFNEDPSFTLQKHSQSGQCDPDNRLKKRPKCCVRRCKEILTFSNTNVCKSYGGKTCLKHRFPSDHAHGGQTNAVRETRNDAGLKFLRALDRRKGTE